MPHEQNKGSIPPELSMPTMEVKRGNVYAVSVLPYRRKHEPKPQSGGKIRRTYQWFKRKYVEHRNSS